MKSPIPLFDNLEHLENPYRKIPPLLQQARERLKLPEQTVNTELQLAAQFLYSYRGSPDTFATYRREIERLVQWSWFVEELALRDLKRQHFEKFIEFCQNPPVNWIGLKNVSRFVNSADVQGRTLNPDWRPFVAKISKREFVNGQRPDKKAFSLSASALQSIFAVCSSFYNFLIQEEYADLNPVAQIRQKSKFIRKQQGTTPIRRLSRQQWATVISEITRLADGGQDSAKYERMLFVMTCLYAMYLRISELVETPRWQPGMSDFWKDASEHWWFTTVGKGNKQRDISVSDEMLASLRRYRIFLDMTALPLPGDPAPLLPKTRGKGGISSTRQVRNIVQEAFDLAINRLATEGQTEESEALKLATVHWLRHTGISDDVQSRPREHVRDDAGHGSSAITDRYIDVERIERNESARLKPVNPVDVKG